MRIGNRLVTAVVAMTVVPLALVATSSPAEAAGGSGIAALANANVGKGACSQNTLGGHAFDSSCTGNDGQPEFWCADFARWVWANSGVADTSELDAGAGSFYVYGLDHGTLTGTPAVGDAEIFDYEGDGYAAHVAIVTQVESNGTVESMSGDWDGQPGSESRFSSTSSVVANIPAYLGALASTPDVMGMTISGFVAPVGVSVTPVVGETALEPGTTLASGQQLTSPNGLYALAMQSDGNLVEYLGTRTLWASGTSGHPGATAVMQSDGNLVVYTADHLAAWASGTSGHPGSRLLLRDDARLTVSDGAGSHWSSRPRTGLLASGASLSSGEMLMSGDGVYDLEMQANGDLVEYTAGRALWASRTAGHPRARLLMRANGNLVMYSMHHAVLWQSHTRGHAGATASLRNDADLVVGGVWSNGV